MTPTSLLVLPQAATARFVPGPRRRRRRATRSRTAWALWWTGPSSHSGCHHTSWTTPVGVLIEGLKWPGERTELYLSLLVEVADHSGGGVIDPPATVSDCRDHEDNRILDLVVEVGALLLVSEDTDLTSMSPWRGTPILCPESSSLRSTGCAATDADNAPARSRLTQRPAVVPTRLGAVGSVHDIRFMFVCSFS